MDKFDIGLIGVGMVLLLIVLRMPIGMVLGTVSFVGIWAMLDLRAAWGLLTAIPRDFAAHWALSSVPMFLLMGYICFHAGLTRGLFQVARMWLARLPGGLAIASIGGAAGFAAVTGSSVACAAAMGRISVPEMLRSRYDPGLATATLAAAGTIGALIPPSIIMIVYAIFTEVPISKLFIGGIGAGVLTAVSYVVVVLMWSVIRPDFAPRVAVAVPLRERLAALLDTWPVILLIIGVFGGLFAGVFTATEAGAVGAFLSLVIAWMQGKATREMLVAALTETMVTTAAVFVIAIGANLLTRFLALSGVAGFLSSQVVAWGTDPALLMVLIFLVYLLLGCFLDPLGAMLLTLPLMVPIVQTTPYGMVWFGVILAKYLEIGMITPPVGLNVFVIKGVVGDLISTEMIFRKVIWFLLADFVTVGLMIAFPEIITWLPDRLG